MIDPHFFELASTSAVLAANYLGEVARRKGTHSTEAFQAWLESTAFPVLREQAEQTLKSVISLKANDAEQYQTLLGHLLAIRSGGSAEIRVICPHRIRKS